MPGSQPVAGDSPGRVLRSAREALGLSRREIAEALNLLESTIVAIEDDDSARQPEPVFLRGYVRNYAKLLHLDPEPLVASLNSELRPAATPVKVPKPLVSNRRLWSVAGALLALLILISTVFYLLDAPPQNTATGDAETAAEETGAEDQPGDPYSQSITVETPQPVTERAVPLADGSPASGTTPAAETDVRGEIDADGSRSSENLVSVEEEHSETQDDNADVGESNGAPMIADGAGSAVSTAVDSVPGSVDVPAQSDSATTIKPRRLNRGSDLIRLDFAADCWVRVKDTTGKMLFSDMGRAGGAMELLGQGPFDLLLGNAPGATLKWNGEPVALQPFMRNNVATLKLGETPLAQSEEQPAQ